MTENKNKTHIKKKIYMASSLSDLNMKNNRKNHTKRKNKKYNILIMFFILWLKMNISHLPPIHEITHYTTFLLL